MEHPSNTVPTVAKLPEVRGQHKWDLYKLLFIRDCLSHKMNEAMFLTLAVLLATGTSAARQLQTTDDMPLTSLVPINGSDQNGTVADLCQPGVCGRSKKCCTLVDSWTCVHVNEDCPNSSTLDHTKEP